MFQQCSTCSMLRNASLFSNASFVSCFCFSGLAHWRRGCGGCSWHRRRYSWHRCKVVEVVPEGAKVVEAGQGFADLVLGDVQALCLQKLLQTSWQPKNKRNDVKKMLKRCRTWKTFGSCGYLQVCFQSKAITLLLLSSISSHSFVCCRCPIRDLTVKNLKVWKINRRVFVFVLSL